MDYEFHSKQRVVIFLSLTFTIVMLFLATWNSEKKHHEEVMAAIRAIQTAGAK